MKTDFVTFDGKRPQLELYCWVCGEWLLGGRRDRFLCGPTCRQRWRRMIRKVQAETRLPLPVKVR